MKILKSLVAIVRYLAAAYFIQIATLIAFLVGGAAWSHFGSLWAAAAGFLLVIIASAPIFGLLHGEIKPPAR
ncbi:hypothetical protein GCM10007071_13290 [Marinobacter zhanjiangensis]|uniref:Uncharacterized protein n=2 Tax=Marinobacter zhanjiangensis TaxID=578215 RepID=A0ABQ3AV50_9GAMM|nr:hypothetical protein GCM10007071_13290 [Marinobacter zhanjiangensis]